MRYAERMASMVKNNVKNGIRIPAEAQVRDVISRSASGTEVKVFGCGSIPKPDPAKVMTRFIYHESYCAVYILRGTGVYADPEGGEMRVSAGDMIHRLPGLPHWTVPDADGQWLEFFVLMPKGVFESLEGIGMFQDGRRVWRPGLDEGLLERLISIRRTLRVEGMERRLDATLQMLSFLVEAWRRDRSSLQIPASGPPLDRACDILREDFASPCDIPSLAQRLNVGYELFRKRFKEGMGVSPYAYRARARIDKARELLVNSDLSLSQIASELGFADVYAFAKQFRKAAGIPPARFRAMQR